MKRERINRILQIEMQIGVAERNLEAAKAKAAKWEQRLKMLLQDQLTARLESQLELGPSTRKNQKKYVVWQTVKGILTNAALSTSSYFLGNPLCANAFKIDVPARQTNSCGFPNTHTHIDRHMLDPPQIP